MAVPLHAYLAAVRDDERERVAPPPAGKTHMCPVFISFGVH